MNKGFTLKELAERVGGTIHGDENYVITGIAPLETAGQKDICLARTQEYINKIPESESVSFIASGSFGVENVNFLIHSNPHAAFAKIMALFYPLDEKKPEVDASCKTGDNFSAGKSVYIGAGVVIGDNVEIGDNVSIYPGCIIGDNVSVGSGSVLYGNVSIYPDCLIGKRVIIHSGTVIGSDGFGFASENGSWIKINHTGRVIIEDDVEIGALNTIDRGTFGDTVLKRGVKTDNQVHVGHNVEVGENTLLIAQSGIAGSTKIGKGCIIAGKAGISGHLEIGDHVIIGPMAGVTGNVRSGEVVSGVPQMPHRIWLKAQSIIPRLPELRKKIFSIEKKIKKIEDNYNE